MREILFRGKRIDNGEWVKGYLFKTTGFKISQRTLDFCIQVIDDDLGHWSFNVIPETVGQFTGLLDKNGVKIFEGDIINIERDYSIGIEEYYARIAFSYGSFGFITKYDEKFELFTSFGGLNDREEFSSTTSIIGNIHDNPELLTK